MRHRKHRKKLPPVDPGLIQSLSMIIDCIMSHAEPMTDTGMITAWAVPMSHLPRVDHTYVTSDTGDSWPCFGCADGGARIAHARADVRILQCIAGSDGMARIRYGIDGVCHQIANRLLRPGRIGVAACRGYNLTFTLYGHYGYGTWRWAFCCQVYGADHLLAGEAGPAPIPSGLAEPEAAYVSSMTDRDNFIDESVRRFLALVAAEAHGGLPAARRHEAEAIMADLAGHQFDLMAALERGEIGPEAWLPRFTELLRARYGELGRVLGRDRFERVFGAAPEDAPAVIDPQAFAMTHELSATGRARS